MLDFPAARRVRIACRTAALARLRAVVFLAFLIGAFNVALERGTAFAQSKGDSIRGADRAATCNACHGAPKSAPLPGMPALAGQQAEFLALQMFLLREGLRDVPQMAGMLSGWTDADLSEVAAYFASQTPSSENTPRNPKMHARGTLLLQAMACGSCHMSDFRGQRQVPRITGQREDYLVAALKAYRDNRRTGIDTSMNAAMYQVTDADIQALAHALAHPQ